LLLGAAAGLGLELTWYWLTEVPAKKGQKFFVPQVWFIQIARMNSVVKNPEFCSRDPFVQEACVVWR